LEEGEFRITDKEDELSQPPGFKTNATFIHARERTEEEKRKLI